jgi:GcrA cell cycle regulator
MSIVKNQIARLKAAISIPSEKSWKQDEAEKLEEMYHKGASAGEIAKVLGKTRDAVAGRIRRLKQNKSLIPRNWTQEEQLKLIEMHKAGSTSYQIAKALKKTRGAVSGRVHRLQAEGVLPMRLEGAKPVSKNKLENSRMKSLVRGYFFSAKQKHDCSVSVLEAVSELTEKNCRYPIGELSDPNFKFCCAPKKPGSSYCQEHHELCWRPVPNDRRGIKKAFSLPPVRPLASR